MSADATTHLVRIHINRKVHQSPNPTTGGALYVLGDISKHEHLYREISGDREDQLVQRDGTRVHLTENEHFYSQDATAHPENVEVHVVHVNEVERATFKESVKATLAAVWDRAYKELHLQRQPDDVFQTGGPHPKSLMGDLALTLYEAREKGLIEDYRFGIAHKTGGA